MHSLKGMWLLMRMNKPVGIYLLLWPTLWALWLASVGMPEWDILVIFVLGVVVMRAAGCVINDIADRKIDGHVKRTVARPLITGQVSLKQAWALFAGLLLCALVLVLQLNIQTLYLSFVAVLLASAYPFLKRHTHLPQVALGAAFSWAIPMAFMAVNQHVPLWAWWLYVANLAWTVAYDTQYAMVDRDDDLNIGVKSTAILFGRYDVVWIAVLQLVTLGSLGMVGLLLSLPMVYWVSLIVVFGMFLYHQRLLKDRERDACFRAFIYNHWAGFVVWLGLVGSFL
ncbi:MAG TPA: 4-hydroxybenzoate octaprenyltransferase [Glaciecola sp.]|nr:4-hydroxybenzoate octaprenyltransferase [Glaciecola sp.]